MPSRRWTTPSPSKRKGGKRRRSEDSSDDGSSDTFSPTSSEASGIVTPQSKARIQKQMKYSRDIGTPSPRRGQPSPASTSLASPRRGRSSQADTSHASPRHQSTSKSVSNQSHRKPTPGSGRIYRSPVKGFILLLFC